MNKLKIIFQEACIISTAIFLANGIYGGIAYGMEEEFSLNWLTILSIIFTGFFSSLPSLVFMKEDGLTQKNFKLSLVFHFLSTWAVVTIAAFLFKWCSNMLGYVSIFVSFLLIYIFVWVMTSWLYSNEEKQINSALKDIQDEE